MDAAASSVSAGNNCSWGNCRRQATESVIAGEKTPEEAAAAYEKRLIEIVGADRVERAAR